MKQECMTKREQVEEKIHTKQLREELLSTITIHLLTSENPQKIICDLGKKTMDYLGCHVFFNYIVDHEKKRLRLNAWAGIPEEEVRNLEWLDYGTAVCGSVAQEGKRIVAENIPLLRDWRVDSIRAFGVLSYACHPLCVGSQMIGTLGFGSRTRMRFTDDELLLMKTVADLIAIAMNRLITGVKLLESEKKYRQLFESINEGFAINEMIYDQQGRPVDYLILETNPAWDLQMGIAGIAVAGKKISELFGVRPSCLRRYNKVITTGNPIQFEKYFACLGRWLNVRAYSLHQGNRFAAIFTDITKRKQMDEVLRRDQKQLEELVRRRTRELEEANLRITYILDSIKDPFFALDGQWRFIYVNSGAKALFPCSENLIGQSIWLKFPLIMDRYRQRYKEVMNNKKPIVFEENWDDGLWWEINVYPFGEGVSVLFRDITGRKLADEKLRMSEERFYKIFHNNPDIMTILGLEDNKYIEINKKFTDILGYSRGEAVGRTPWELNILGDEKIYTAFMCRGLDSKDRINFEIDFRAKSGRIINTICSTEVIVINQKKYRLEVIKDITREKKNEAEMARLDRLNLVGEMAAGIGHEVRNPMTTVKGFLQLLRNKDKYAQEREYFDLMMSELDRANSIISEFLSLAKNKVIELKMMNLNRILESLLPLIEADGLVTDKYIKLETSPIPNLMLDEKEIRQLVLNLVRNGLEAMPPGGTVIIKTYTEDKEAVLAVKDSGKGMPPEVLEKIGTPFFTTKDSGTGLGLPVCYSIAARHKARIDIESRPGGTTFLVRFNAPEV